MELEKFIKNLQMGEDRTRVINAEGEVIAEHFDDYRGTSVDLISATWAKKTRNETKVGAIQPRHL
jgi:hypothetical protein